MCYPSVVEPVAEWLDKQLWNILESATGLSIPRSATTTTWNCVLNIPVEGRSNRSFQDWVVRQPVRLGGLASDPSLTLLVQPSSEPSSRPSPLSVVRMASALNWLTFLVEKTALERMHLGKAGGE